MNNESNEAPATRVDTTGSGAPVPGPVRVRWWPAALVVVAATARLVWTWVTPGQSRQEQVMRTGGVGLVAVGLLLLWVLLASRLPWRVRWRVLGGFVAVLAVLAACFRFVGVSGDLVPIFEPRWAARPAPARLAAATAPSAGADAARSVAPPQGSVAGAVPVRADFPQFLGPRRDGVIEGVRLDPDFTARPPQLLWRAPMGSGWGGFVVAGDLAITQEQDGEDERVTAYEAGSGRLVWEHRTRARYDNPVGGIGPRATPTVVSNRVYVLGAVGDLSCHDLATGRALWSTNVVEHVPAKDLVWGLSGSPLVLGDRVIIAPLGRPQRASLMALDAATGRTVWVGGTADAHYSSPRLETVRGMAQLLTFTAAGAAGHDPADGRLLWEHPWRGGHPHVTDPRVVDAERGRVLISSGYGTGSQLIEVERAAEGGGWRVSTNVVWRSMRLKSKFANLILRGGHVFGLDDGKLVCLDAATGERAWEGDRYGHGQLLLVDDLLLLTAESGDVVVVDADPAAFRERGRFPAVTGKTWNPPALAGDLLVVRNEREAAAFRMAVKR